MVAPSVQADVIDYDEHRTGQRKEGTYFAAWSLAFKTAGGFSIILTGFALQYAGFTPNAEQSETTKLALRILIAIVPAVLYAASAAMLARFRLNEREHAEIRAALAQSGALQTAL
jgi:GPH family glycoside/pentoside/hexuronide:cation symporter